eukprot:gene39434-48731_t
MVSTDERNQQTAYGVRVGQGGEDVVNMAVESDSEGGMIAKNPKVMNVLTFIPQVIQFAQRVHIFNRLLEFDRDTYYSVTEGGQSVFAAMMGQGSIHMRVHRDNLVEDAYRALEGAGAKIKGRIQVEFISHHNTVEAGIDGGGLFKEFLDAFSKSIFGGTNQAAPSSAAATTSTSSSSSGSSSNTAIDLTSTNTSVTTSSTPPPYFIPTSSQLLTINPDLSVRGLVVTPGRSASVAHSARG